MKITVKVTPGASRNSVEEVGVNLFKVKTTKKAIKGQANEAVIRLLAEHFKVKPSHVELIQGETSRSKLMEVSF